MGIHGLNPLIKKYDPDTYKQCHYTQFAGKRLAMDVSIFLHKYVHTDRHTWFTQLCNFFVKMRKANIVIIAVFDGEHVPVEKYLERANRRVTSDKTKDRLGEIQTLQEMLFVHYQSSYKMLAEHTQRVATILKLDPNDTHLDLTSSRVCMRELNTLEEKVSNQAARVDSKVVNAAQELVAALGISRVTAYGEAEALCASLNVHGYVDGVLSRDTDSLAYGSPLFVCEFKSDTFTWTTYDDVLAALDLSSEQFRDLCIMCGCDYNTNMSKIAAGKSYKLIAKYGSIEAIEQAETVDTTCLRYQRCREIFTPYSRVYIDGFKIAPTTQPVQDQVEHVFAVHNCRLPWSYIYDTWNPCTEVEFED